MQHILSVPYVRRDGQWKPFDTKMEERYPTFAQGSIEYGAFSLLKLELDRFRYGIHQVG